MRWRRSAWDERSSGVDCGGRRGAEMCEDEGHVLPVEISI